MRKLLLSTALLGASALFGGGAQATLLLQSGIVGGNQGTDNVIFNACGPGGNPGPALTVTGCLNTAQTTYVNFTGVEQLFIPAGGQARVDAVDGSFDRVQINLANPTLGFSKLIFNLDANQSGTASFQAVDQFGTTFTFNNLPITANGQNFFTLYSLDNQVARSFSLTSTVGVQAITDLQQVRLGPATLTPNVPEPASLALLGAGLLGLGWMRRRG